MTDVRPGRNSDLMILAMAEARRLRRLATTSVVSDQGPEEEAAAPGGTGTAEGLVVDWQLPGEDLRLRV